MNADIVRTLKMIYDVTGNWGDEYRELVEMYFHEQNLTLSALRSQRPVSIQSTRPRKWPMR